MTNTVTPTTQQKSNQGGRRITRTGRMPHIPEMSNNK